MSTRAGFSSFVGARAWLAASLFLALPVAAQTLPKLNGRISALGDASGDGVIDRDDYTLSASHDEGRNTYDACKLDASVGFDLVLQDLGLSNEFAPIGVLEGNMTLTDPPLDMSAPSGTRRILRGSGGLRLYLVHNGSSTMETFKFAHWGTETRKFEPRQGCMQTAETLAEIYSPYHSRYAPLANLFVDASGAPAKLSVRKVRAFLGSNGRPWLFVTCSTLDAPTTYSPAGPSGNTDVDYATASRAPRLFAWDITLRKFVDVTTARIPAASGTWWNGNASGLAIGDLNNDGRKDIVIGYYGDNWYGRWNHILLQDANSNFQEIRSAYDPFPTLIGTPTDIEIADLDGDSYADIVVANRYRFGYLPSFMSQNYILWGTGYSAHALPQPSFTAPQYLLDVAGNPAEDDTMALDVADVDSPPDGKLDLVFGNHGVPGTVFVLDNPDPNATCGQITANADLFYHQGAGRSFTCYELPGSNGSQLTTDIVFRDVAKPNRVAFGQPGWPWDFSLATAVEDTSTTPSTWHAGLVLDQLPEIVRVFRGRGYQGISYYLNDPANSFDGYLDANGNVVTTFLDHLGVSHPILPGSAHAAWHFLPLASTIPPFGPWCMTRYPSTTPPLSNPAPGFIEQYQRLTSSEFLLYPQVLLFGDFVPDGPTTQPPYAGWPDQKGFPDLFVGMGYELGGVNNRMYPFTSSQFVDRISGSEFPGVNEIHRGVATYTADWMETSSHGYGMTLIDSDDDGDLDAIDSKRTALYLYENLGAPGTTSTQEGVLRRVTGVAASGDLKWPFVDLPYAHSRLFTEDTACADFDEDGDLDVFTVGQCGETDYSINPPITRGETNDEDTNKEGWNRHASTPMNEGLFKATDFVENLTHDATPQPGVFANRGDRLDFNGRDDLSRGGDRIVVADFDNDGKLDAFEACWVTEGDGESGFNLPATDPTLTPTDLWHGAVPRDYDHIAPFKYVGYRLWHNVMPAVPSSVTTWFRDMACATAADPWIYCIDSASAKHFGPLDARGGTDWLPGTTSETLHRRVHLGLAAADFNNDGWVDVLTGWMSPDGKSGGYNLFLNDQTGRLVDSSNLLPAYSSADVGGTAKQPSQGLCVADFDNDGDVDIVISFFGGHRTALIENTFTAAGGLSFAARPYDYPASANGWVEGAQKGFNGDSGDALDPNGDRDYLLWPVPIDIDLDGDQDLLVFGASVGHRFFKNLTIDATSPAHRFVEASLDSIPNCANPYDRDAILNSARITIHNGAGVGDAEVGDLNGDGWLDVAALYGHRPSNVYINDRGGAAVSTNVPHISTVFPATGVKKREWFRLYGTKLSNIVQVDLILATTTVTIPAGPAITYPTGHDRYVNVAIPNSVTAKGPARIRVTRNVGGTLYSSPIFGGTPFTVR